MGNISRTIFPQRCWDTSTPSSTEAVLTVDMNQFGWKADTIVLLSVPCLHSYSADGKRKMSSGGSSWHDGRRREGGCGGVACLPEPGSSQMNGAVKGDEGTRKHFPRQFSWRNKITGGMIDKLEALCT